MVAENNAENGKISTVIGENGKSGDGLADFERAISYTGFGSYNVLLLLAVLPIAWTAVFDATTGAFILASAECDFQLTFFKKGVLVAVPYIGMFLTSFLWDHVSDYVGKRTLFVLGLLADVVLNIASTAVDSYYAFLALKFLSGVIDGGPFAMILGYLTEFHSAKYKLRYSRMTGFLFTMPTIVPAALAFIILPLDWNIKVFGRDYNTWRIYLLICTIPSILGLITAWILPQSPKQLVQAGKTEEALKLFKRMYSMNTGKPADTFPIKVLLASQKSLPPRPILKAHIEKLRTFWYNAKLLLSSPYLPAFSFVTFLQFASMLGFHTMRLWVPHLFIILNNFDWEHWPDGRAPTICEMLDRRGAKPGRKFLDCPNFDDTCFTWHINPSVYQNSTTIASSAVIFGFLVGLIMSTKRRKTILLVTTFLISVVSSFGINWAQAPPYMLTLAAAIIVMSRIAGNIVTAVNVDVIPIPLRQTSVSISTAAGNAGAILGNFIFSALLGSECLVSFMSLGCFFSFCFCVSFFVPRPVKPSPKNLVLQQQQHLPVEIYRKTLEA